MPFKDLREFEKYLKDSEPKRKETYARVCHALETEGITYEDMIMVLDMLNSQTIIALIKDEWSAVRSCDLLKVSAQKIIKATFKQGIAKNINVEDSEDNKAV